MAEAILMMDLDPINGNMVEEYHSMVLVEALNQNVDNYYALTNSGFPGNMVHSCNVG